MTKLIQADFNGQAMQFTADGWFNATTAAAKYGKRPNDWLSLPETGKYLEALTRKYGEIPFFKTKRGGDTGKSGNAQGTWLHPKLAVRFAQWLDMDFAIWCDEQIDALIRGQTKPDDWSAARVAAASNHRLLCDMVNLHRQAIGKGSTAHHYANEARLINWAFSGRFSPIDRDALSVPELRLLELLERQDAVLLGAGKGYDERKAALQAFATEQRQRLAIPANDVAGRISA
ncbi:KilA-N domain-containing protein [Chromobacterium sp. IIBBL 290-4]|uniref:KilA-N domain-containing protein n=1 Tax=Chromobacterium sp. IIBBL 290-4 TaxID=2953890 RepID=UPI0020B879B0|nr:KilA-N domain-containing protein [Chromobacterium sp. IIBBL 290-4]UTH72510.1 KilA-N domain-containing protein [Chromobacterium sp. IIBBL 290-4]